MTGGRFWTWSSGVGPGEPRHGRRCTGQPMVRFDSAATPMYILRPAFRGVGIRGAARSRVPEGVAEMGFRENGCGRLIRVKGTDWSGHLDWPVNESRQASMSGPLLSTENLTSSFRRSRPSRVSPAGRRGAGKGPARSGANPCRRAPFGYGQPSTGGGAETRFPLVSLELLLRLPCAVGMIF